MAKRVVIVGAGPGGLASSMLLANAGFDVTVVERLNQVGGRTSTIDANGFRFDLGPTFFLYPQVLESIFEMCGRSLHDEVRMERLDPQYHLVFENGGEIHATSDVEAMQSQIAQIAPGDACNLPQYMADNRKKLAAFQPILESPFSGFGDVMRLPLAKLLPLLRPWSSVDSDLARQFSDPRIRLAFSFQSKYLGMSPFQCPSLFTILSFIEYEHGVWHPMGGCGEVSRAMARVAEQQGVRIRLNEPVQRVLFDGKRAVGVETELDRYPCDALVINADFANAMSTLVPDHLRSRWNDRKLAKKKYSCSTFMMYLGLEGRWDDLEHHTIFLADDYRQNLTDIESSHQLSENPSFYVHNPVRSDPSMAPDGMTSLYVLVPVTHMHPNVSWTEQQDAFRELTLNQLEKVGVRNVREHIRYERVITPQNWQDDYQIYNGATFNLAHSLDQMLHLRPRNRFEDLQGVYLTGGGTHPGSGLPVIFESSKISSRLLAADFGLESAWEIDTSRPQISHTDLELAGVA